MEKYLKILKKCPLFYGIDDNSLSKMLGCLGATVEIYDKKYTVFAEGNRANHIGIVLSGGVQIIQVDYNGNRSILSGVTPGETFCESFAAAETDRLPISVIASEASEIMLIRCSHILHTCSNNCAFHQRLIYNLMKDIAQKNIMFHQRLEITSNRTTREKLLTFLSIQSKKAGSRTFDIPFDRQELADYLEVDRSGLSNEISKLRDEGVLESNRKHFTLL